MSEIYLLDDGTSSIGISPIRGQNEPESRGREVMRAKDGRIDVHEYGGKEVFEAPFNNVSEADADLMIQWWENMTTITFTPDLQNDPGTTLEVKIAEQPRPMQMFGGTWDDLFAGMLTLYQISSVSFSSSSASVSGSRSCSSWISSQSCSTGSSLSCSVFLTSVSRSSSLGFDVENVSVSSCDDVETRPCSTWSSSSSDGWVTLSSCSDSVSRSCSSSVSRSSSSSVGVIAVSFTSQSCSNDPSSTSCSTSEGGSSCSVSGAG